MSVMRSLQILTAIGVIALLWFGLDGPAALQLFARAQPIWLFAALMALTAQTVLSAMRWRLTARQLGQPIPRLTAIKEYYLSQIVNQSLPGGVLGDAGRAVRGRHQAGLRRASAAVMIERLSGQLAMFAVLAMGVLAVMVMPGVLMLPTWVPDLIGALLVAGLTIGGAIYIQCRTGDAARGLRDALRLTLLAPGIWPRQVALNLAITAANLAAFVFCARATGTAMSLTETIVLVPLILFTMILPLTVSGWGLREGAAAGLFPLIGASAQAGLAASVAFGLMFLVSSLPGLLVLVAQRHHRYPCPNAIAQADP